MTETVRLSVPRVIRSLPRPVSGDELAQLARIADSLCRGDGSVPLPSRQEEFPQSVHTALLARSDAFDSIMDVVAAAPQEPPDLEKFLRALHDSAPDDFQAVSAVVAGAYLMIPEIAAAVGYRGQRRNYPGSEDIANDLEGGILDPVIERGTHRVLP